MKKKYSDECVFCVKYLKDHGIVSRNWTQLARLAMDLDVDFELVKIEKDPDTKKTHDEIRREFFEDVAQDLRLLWPVGSKDGRWPWRTDKLSLASRLATLWRERNLSENITKEEILKVAREYIDKFEGDTKYMKICKYFVYKHVGEPTDSGKSLVTSQSPLADALDDKKETMAIENEWDDIFNQASVGEGELV